MTYHSQKERGCGHVTVLKFCRDAARRAGSSARAALLVLDRDVHRVCSYRPTRCCRSALLLVVFVSVSK